MIGAEPSSGPRVQESEEKSARFAREPTRARCAFLNDAPALMNSDQLCEIGGSARPLSSFSLQALKFVSYSYGVAPHATAWLLAPGRAEACGLGAQTNGRGSARGFADSSMIVLCQSYMSHGSLWGQINTCTLPRFTKPELIKLAGSPATGNKNAS